MPFTPPQACSAGRKSTSKLNYPFTPPQAYIGSPIAKEDADKDLTSYAAFSDELLLLVDPAQEVTHTRTASLCP